jgi:electron transfer flavoprotein beta subunit
VTDDTLGGSDALSTARVVAAALRTLEYDLVLAGADTSDGGAGVVPPAIATILGLPYLSYAARIEPDPAARRVRVHRIGPAGYDVIESAMPALVACTQALGAPRYPSLKGIMAARGKEIATLSLADVGVADDVGGAVAGTKVVDARPPAARGATRIVRGPAEDAAREVVEFLAERRIV